MASDEDVCTNYPDFAVICSFVENFGDKLNESLPNIEELQVLLEDDDGVSPLLIQLIVQLLRRINKCVKYDKWERALTRYAYTYSIQDGWELERFGFKNAKLEVKIRVLKNILEAQFDKYKSFKDKVNSVSAKDLRLQPCGRDKHGVSYWSQMDELGNLRIYKDDQDEETWTLVARSREELVALIQELQSNSQAGLTRETSVDESPSESVTPLALSEAPTPVGSKTGTPVTSGRTSPVLDTGQPKEKFKNDEEPMDNVPDVKSEQLTNESLIKEGQRSSQNLPKVEEKVKVETISLKLPSTTKEAFIKSEKELLEVVNTEKEIDSKETSTSRLPENQLCKNINVKDSKIKLLSKTSPDASKHIPDKPVEKDLISQTTGTKNDPLESEKPDKIIPDATTSRKEKIVVSCQSTKTERINIKETTQSEPPEKVISPQILESKLPEKVPQKLKTHTTNIECKEPIKPPEKPTFHIEKEVVKAKSLQLLNKTSDNEETVDQPQSATLPLPVKADIHIPVYKKKVESTSIFETKGNREIKSSPNKDMTLKATDLTKGATSEPSSKICDSSELKKYFGKTPDEKLSRSKDKIFLTGNESKTQSTEAMCPSSHKDVTAKQTSHLKDGKVLSSKQEPNICGTSSSTLISTGKEVNKPESLSSLTKNESQPLSTHSKNEVSKDVKEILSGPSHTPKEVSTPDVKDYSVKDTTKLILATSSIVPQKDVSKSKEKDAKDSSFEEVTKPLAKSSILIDKDVTKDIKKPSIKEVPKISSEAYQSSNKSEDKSKLEKEDPCNKFILEGKSLDIKAEKSETTIPKVELTGAKEISKEIPVSQNLKPTSEMGSSVLNPVSKTVSVCPEKLKSSTELKHVVSALTTKATDLSVHSKPKEIVDHQSTVVCSSEKEIVKLPCKDIKKDQVVLDNTKPIDNVALSSIKGENVLSKTIPTATAVKLLKNIVSPVPEESKGSLPKEDAIQSKTPCDLSMGKDIPKLSPNEEKCALDKGIHKEMLPTDKPKSSSEKDLKSKEESILPSKEAIKNQSEKLLGSSEKIIADSKAAILNKGTIEITAKQLTSPIEKLTAKTEEKKDSSRSVDSAHKIGINVQASVHETISTNKVCITDKSKLASVPSSSQTISKSEDKLSTDHSKPQHNIGGEELSSPDKKSIRNDHPKSSTIYPAEKLKPLEVMKPPEKLNVPDTKTGQTTVSTSSETKHSKDQSVVSKKSLSSLSAVNKPSVSGASVPEDKTKTESSISKNISSLVIPSTNKQSDKTSPSQMALDLSKDLVHQSDKSKEELKVEQKLPTIDPSAPSKETDEKENNLSQLTKDKLGQIQEIENISQTEIEAKPSQSFKVSKPSNSDAVEKPSQEDTVTKTPPSSDKVAKPSNSDAAPKPSLDTVTKNPLSDKREKTSILDAVSKPSLVTVTKTPPSSDERAKPSNSDAAPNPSLDTVTKTPLSDKGAKASNSDAVLKPSQDTVTKTPSSDKGEKTSNLDAVPKPSLVTVTKTPPSSDKVAKPSNSDAATKPSLDTVTKTPPSSDKVAKPSNSDAATKPSLDSVTKTPLSDKREKTSNSDAVLKPSQDTVTKNSSSDKGAKASNSDAAPKPSLDTVTKTLLADKREKTSNLDAVPKPSLVTVTKTPPSSDEGAKPSNSDAAPNPSLDAVTKTPLSDKGAKASNSDALSKSSLNTVTKTSPSDQEAKPSNTDKETKANEADAKSFLLGKETKPLQIDKEAKPSEMSKDTVCQSEKEPKISQSNEENKCTDKIALQNTDLKSPKNLVHLSTASDSKNSSNEKLIPDTKVLENVSFSKSVSASQDNEKSKVNCPLIDKSEPSSSISSAKLDSEASKTSSQCSSEPKLAKGSEKSSTILDTSKPEVSSGDVGEAIEEPVMVVKGDGEGAACESGNDGSFQEDSLPWWEDFSSGRLSDHLTEQETVIEEVRYFWGLGNGADCDAGNSGDEETKTSTKGKRRTRSALGKKSEEEDDSKFNGVKNKTNKVEPISNCQDNKKCPVETDSTDKEKITDIKSDPPVEVNSTEGVNGKPESTLKQTNEDSEEVDDEEEPVPVVKKARGRPKRTSKLPKSRKAKTQDQDQPEDDEEEDEQSSPTRRKHKGRSLDNEAPRQRSARIAKIREREETERRELEAQRLKQLSEESRMRELKQKARVERRAVREIRKDKKTKKKDKKKKKRRKKTANKTGDPWSHSSSSSPSSEEEEDDLGIEEENEELIFKSDHEFSPESDVGEEDAQPIKRARTAKKGKVESKKEESEEFEDDTKCQKCGHEDHPETILLCDSCEVGWHLSCLRPPLFSVPEGDWVCPTCEHTMLIEKLSEILGHFDVLKKKVETEELRKQRLAYINVSLDNVIPEKKKKNKEDGYDEDSESGSDTDNSSSNSESESSSEGSNSGSSTPPLYTLRARPSRTPKEQVQNFDELINEAIRDEMEAALMVKKSGVGRGKDMSTVTKGGEEVNDEELEADANEEEEDEDDEEKEDAKEAAKGRGKEMRDDDDEDEEEVKEKLPKKEVRIKEDDDEDDEEVAPKRKKKKLNEEDDYEEGDEGSEYEASEPESPVARRKGRQFSSISSRKRRRLTDLDVEEDEDDSDEDFMGTSDEDEEEEDASDAMSSDFATESESDDSDVGSRKRKGILPLRRSTRNQRNASYDTDDSDDRKSKKQKKKKKKRRRFSSSSEEEESSTDSDKSYGKKRSKKKRTFKPVSSKKRGNRKRQKKSNTKKRKIEDNGEPKPKPKPRIKYSKPPKTKEEVQEELTTRKRVTRGRQINYYDSLLMSDDDFEDEDSGPKSRGKVMKGERRQTESSDYEESDDEMKKRRGVRGGLGKGKVMKGEEDEDYSAEEDEDSVKLKKKKEEEEEGPPYRGKPESATQPPKKETFPIKYTAEEKPLAHPIPQIKTAPLISPSPVRMTVNRPGALPLAAPLEAMQLPPVTLSRGPPPIPQLITSPNPPAIIKFGGPRLPPQIQVARSPTPITQVTSSLSITPVAVVPNPNAPHQGSVRPAAPSKQKGNSPSQLPKIPSQITMTRTPRPLVTTAKGPMSAPVLTASTISRVPSSSVVRSALPPPPKSVPPAPHRSSPEKIFAGGSLNLTAKRGLGKDAQGPMGKWSPHIQGGNGGATTPPHAPGTPPRSVIGPPTSVNSSPPPPYRSSPVPVSASPGSGVPTVIPPTTSHPAGYPYPPQEHFSNYPPGYHPGGASHSPGPPRHHHPMYGHPMSHYPQGLPPHPGVLRGPPHDVYRHGPPHAGHRPLLLKQGYPGLEPLPYPRSPGPIDATGPGRQSAPGNPKEAPLTANKKAAPNEGEFSSGLMSYFSSQREDDVE